MPRFICPACKHSSLDPETIEALCPMCGFCSTAHIQWEVSSEPGVDVRKLARRQRLLMWATLACLVSYAVLIAYLIVTGGGTMFGPVAFMLWFATMVSAGLASVWMIAALADRPGLVLLFGMTCWVPFLNLIVLLYANHQVNLALQRAGLRVGFFGVSDREVVRLLSPFVCLKCGYDLTGNVSGICPECGSVVRKAEPARP